MIGRGSGSAGSVKACSAARVTSRSKCVGTLTTRRMVTKPLDRFQVVAPGLEQATGTAQEALLLVAALGELPERCREALLLSRVEGATHLAIARRLGVSPKTVERDIARALRHCVERLSRETPSARV